MHRSTSNHDRQSTAVGFDHRSQIASSTPLPSDSGIDLSTTSAISFSEPRVFHRPPLPPTARSRSPASGSPTSPFQLSQVMQSPTASTSGRNSPTGAKSVVPQFTTIEQILANDQSIRLYLKQLRQHSELDYQLLSRVLSLSLVDKTDVESQTDALTATVALLSTATQTSSVCQHKETQTRESRILSSKLLEAEHMLENFRLHQLDSALPAHGTASTRPSEPQLNETERAQLLRNLIQMNVHETSRVVEAPSRDELHVARPILIDWPNDSNPVAVQTNDLLSDLDSLSTMDTSAPDLYYQSLASERHVNAEYRKLRRYLDKYERQRAKLEQFEQLERMHQQMSEVEQEEVMCNGDCGLMQSELDDANEPCRMVRLSSGQTLQFDEYHQPIVESDDIDHRSNSQQGPVKRVRLPEQQHQVDQVRIVEEDVDESNDEPHEMRSTHDHFHGSSKESGDEAHLVDDQDEEDADEADRDNAEEEQLNSMLIVPDQFQDHDCDRQGQHSLVMNKTRLQSPASVNRFAAPCVRTQSTILIEMGDNRGKECAEISSRTELTREGALCRKTSVTSRMIQSPNESINPMVTDSTRYANAYANVRSPQPIITSPPTTAATTPSATLRRGQQATGLSSSASSYHERPDGRGVTIHSVPVSPLPPISRCDSALDLPDSGSESPFPSSATLNGKHRVSSVSSHTGHPGSTSTRPNSSGLAPAYSESALHTNAPGVTAGTLNDHIQMGISAPSVSFNSPLFEPTDERESRASSRSGHPSDSKSTRRPTCAAPTNAARSSRTPDCDGGPAQNDLYRTLPRLMKIRRQTTDSARPANCKDDWKSSTSATVTNELQAEPLPHSMRTGNGSCVMALSTETNIQTGPEATDRRIETKSRAVRKYDRPAVRPTSSHDDQPANVISAAAGRPPLSMPATSCANCAHCVQKKMRSASSRSLVNESNCCSIDAHLSSAPTGTQCCACTPDDDASVSERQPNAKQRQMFVHHSPSPLEQQLFRHLPHSSSIVDAFDDCDCGSTVDDGSGGDRQPSSPSPPHHHFLTNSEQPWQSSPIPLNHSMRCDCSSDCEIGAQRPVIHSSRLQQSIDRCTTNEPIESDNPSNQRASTAIEPIDCVCRDCFERPAPASELYLDEMRSKPGSDSGISSSLSHRSVGKQSLRDGLHHMFEPNDVHHANRSAASHALPIRSSGSIATDRTQLLPVGIDDWALTPIVHLDHVNSSSADTNRPTSKATEIVNRITKTKIPEYEYRRGRNGEQKRRKVGNRNKLVFEQQLQSPARDRQSGPCHINSWITMDIPSRLLTSRKKRSKPTKSHRSKAESGCAAESNDPGASDPSKGASDEQSANTGQLSLSSLSSCSSFASSVSDSLSTEDEINTQTKFQRFRPVLIAGDQKQTTWEYSVDCACKNGINASVR
jgi:hypothetical protein